MDGKRAAVCVLFLLACVGTSGAFDIDRETLAVRQVRVPSVPVEGLDLAAVHAEVAHGRITLGEPVLRKTTTICVPDGSNSPLKDAVEIPTHYYEIPYRAGRGVIVIRTGDGEVLHAARIEALESYDRFGYDRCRYWRPEPLASDFEREMPSIRAAIEKNARDYFLRSAEEIVEDALFFEVRNDKVPIYTFRDKQRDYADLNEAARLAVSGYAAWESGAREELEQAVTLWERALGESDLTDRDARINLKVTRRLQESLGAARMVLGDPDRAVIHLEKANRLGTVTSRSDDTGTGDLLRRARELKARARRNAAAQESRADLEALMRNTNAFRGRIPIGVTPPTDLPRLEAEYNAFTTATIVEELDAERTERKAGIASGGANPYERMVGRSAMQGFYLFLMPYPEKLSSFPSEICALTHLNRLRVPNHLFERLPEEIGELKALEILDLSGNHLRALPPSIGELENLEKLDLTGNRLESLPGEVAELKKLKVLQLRGNPLAPGELARLKRLLPHCKIKS